MRSMEGSDSVGSGPSREDSDSDPGLGTRGQPLTSSRWAILQHLRRQLNRSCCSLHAPFGTTQQDEQRLLGLGGS